jgi:hypothetical protein
MVVCATVLAFERPSGQPLDRGRILRQRLEQVGRDAHSTAPVGPFVWSTLADAGPAAVAPPFHDAAQSATVLAISLSLAQFQVTPRPLLRVRLLDGRSDHRPLPSANGRAR